MTDDLDQTQVMLQQLNEEPSKVGHKMNLSKTYIKILTNKLQRIVQISMERSMSRVTHRDRTTNQWFQQQTRIVHNINDKE